jgi:tetraacyldisaccharide 4'-kinase
VIGDGVAARLVAAELSTRGKPVFSARLRPDEASIAALRGKRVLAFAGIGDPGRFFNSLRATGIEVTRQRVFADHHSFSKHEIESLIADAGREGLTLVTTEKDLARLRVAGQSPIWAQAIVTFGVSLEFADPGQMRTFVSDRLFKAREQKLRR